MQIRGCQRCNFVLQSALSCLKKKLKIQFGYLFHLFSFTDHPNLVIYPAIVGSMASETVKVFKTDQEQEEDTLPEEVKNCFFFRYFELFTIWFHKKRISNFHEVLKSWAAKRNVLKLGRDQI